MTAVTEFFFFHHCVTTRTVPSMQLSVQLKHLLNVQYVLSSATDTRKTTVSQNDILLYPHGGSSLGMNPDIDQVITEAYGEVKYMIRKSKLILRF